MKVPIRILVLVIAVGFVVGQRGYRPQEESLYPGNYGTRVPQPYPTAAPLRIIPRPRAQGGYVSAVANGYNHGEPNGLALQESDAFGRQPVRSYRNDGIVNYESAPLRGPVPSQSASQPAGYGVDQHRGPVSDYNDRQTNVKNDDFVIKPVPFHSNRIHITVEDEVKKPEPQQYAVNQNYGFDQYQRQYALGHDDGRYQQNNNQNSHSVITQEKKEPGGNNYAYSGDVAGQGGYLGGHNRGLQRNGKSQKLILNEASSKVAYIPVKLLSFRPASNHYSKHEDRITYNPVISTRYEPVLTTEYKSVVLKGNDAGATYGSNYEEQKQ